MSDILTRILARKREEVAERAARVPLPELAACCRDLPDPAPDAMFAHVYAEPQDLVQQEQRWWREYLGADHG